MDLKRTGRYGMFGHHTQYEVRLTDEEITKANEGLAGTLQLGVECGRSAVMEHGVTHEDGLDLTIGQALAIESLRALRIGMRIGREVAGLPIQIDVKEKTV